jgi:hypothetical protein
MTRVALLLALTGIGVLMPAAAARADFLPSRPITFWNDRLVISGDATVTIGQPDHGYFNALDYYHDALNLARFGLSIELKANERIAVLGQVIDQIALRSGSSSDAWSDETPPPLWDPFDTNRHIVRPYALFVRVRPLLDKPITVQAGRIPPVFGAYVTQDYGASQPLISLPLAYHYPTTLRPDSVGRARRFPQRQLDRLAAGAARRPFLHAAGDWRGRRIFARLLAVAIRNDRQFVAHAGARSAVPRRTTTRVVDVSRRTLPRDAAALRRRAWRVSRLLEDSGRRGIQQPACRVGRAGDARGDWRGLFDPAQRARQAGVSV